MVWIAAQAAIANEQRGWARDYCLKKDDFVDSETSKNYCRYGGKDCPIYENRSSSGGCYLTTACVEHKGLADDCVELMTLRGFRDGYMSDLEQGRKDIEEYYKTALGIVEAINSTEEADEVYAALYSDVIVPCVELIRAGQNKKAYEKYKDMVKSLEDKYC